MNGFIVTLSTDGSPLPGQYCWKPLFNFQQEHRSKKYVRPGVMAGQFTSDRFHRHKFFEETEAGLLITEGLITNVEVLYKKHHCSTAGRLIYKLIKTRSLQELHGNFAGVYYDHATQKLTAFNNHTGTQKVYYFRSDSYTVVATDLKVLTTTLRSLGITLAPDYDAVEMLLSYGFMLEDYTFVTQIRQLTAGQLLHANKERLQLDRYFELGTIERKQCSKEQFIEQLEQQFQQAVHEEYALDEAYGYTSLATLSGGLDSRMTTLVAHKAGYQQELINFSHKGYADEVIARQIARHYQLRLSTVELSAESLTAIDDVVRVNDGMTLYSGASHVFQALRQLRLLNSGIVHTGMLGDAIMGSYLSAPFDTLPKSSSGAYSNRISNRSEQLFNTIVSRYCTEELFKFYNRAFQGINTGYQYLYLVGESLSPFMHPDFIQLALSIPREYMYKERLYIDWMRKKHPQEAAFCWENIGGKPTNNDVMRRLYRFKRAVIKRLPVVTMWKNSMTPEQSWYENSEKVRKVLDTYYYDHYAHSVIDSHLQKQLNLLYSQRDFTSKAQVLTVLAAFKSLFP
ncbi:MAG: hypothetical protein BGP01_10230 [Paludibacter sp. 47-17]|nr:MAG: hypothetical protein BGP01_10230 [Paludibacter sp. 47-17]